ncbi:unnamed protein product [Xylocopa violacea]|uniref:Uncharacterized protein n=1 Tax=Xylocopa violacea TaxID=135666 RepID=A0ABP1N7I7_XYLVO
MEVPFEYEDILLQCHFHQIHLPQQAIQIAQLDQDRRHFLQEAMFDLSRKDVVHFSLGNVSYPERNYATQQAPKIVS